MTVARQFLASVVDSASLQAPNRAQVWSIRQRPKVSALPSPRFLEVNLEAQPKPLSAIELCKQQEISIIDGRKTLCDGGGPLGHPIVFINLDDPVKPAVCGYCGSRFKQHSDQHRHQ